MASTSLSVSVRFLFVLLLAVLLGPGCYTVPETGRRQLRLLGEQAEIDMGIEAYRQSLEKAPVSKNKQITDMVRRVGMRIAEASGRSDYQWEFTVVEDDKVVNAWALPGGKVAVYTGILPVTKDEAGLATVMGHEVAHATLHHGAERISWDLVKNLGETGLAVAMANKDPKVVGPVMAAFGIGGQLGVLKFSRSQELEADAQGLKYMAMAGYDPAEAIKFWQRMQALTDGGGTPPEFLSTHPSHEHRIRDLEERLPDAKAVYRPR